MTAAIGTARVLGRLVLAVLVAGVAVLASAAPASAHGRGSDATNYDSRITAGPAGTGVAWQVYGGDEYLGVENTTDQTLVVMGYEDEPYLRIGPDGVFENRNSPAAYLNRDRYAQTPVPEGVAAGAEPRWVRVSHGAGWYWHDHRIHWMAPVPPPQIQQAPGAEAVIQTDVVPYTLGEQRHEIEVQLVWVPGPAPWPWLLVGLIASLPALAGLRARERAGRWTGLARPAAAVLGAVAALNLVHLADDLLAVPQPPATTALAAVQTVLFIAIGVFGAVRAWQGGDGAFTALGVGAGALLVGQGLLYASVLGASQIASVAPDPVGRLAVGWSIAQALPVGAVAVIGTRRLLPPAEPVDAPAAEPSGA